MAAIKITLVADVRQFISSFKKGKESVEDIADELEDLAKEGDQTERAFADNFKDIAKDADKAGKKIKANLKEGFDEAGKEASQSGRETAASFSGGFDDVADFVQETLANALGGFGPLGAAAGTALAVALGAALAGAADAQEKLEEAREAAADLSKTLYENNGTLPMAEAIDATLDILTRERTGNIVENWINAWADLGTNLDAVRAASRKAAVPVNTLVRQLSGQDIASIPRTIEAIQKAIEAIDVGPMDLAGLGEQSQLRGLIDQLKIVKNTADLADDALGLVGAAFDSAAYTAKVDAIGQAWQDAATDASAYITESEGVTTFDWSKYLADAEATLAAANQFKRDILTVPPDIRAEAESIFADQGAVAANAYVSAYTSADAANKGRFEAAAKANSGAVGKAAGEELARQAEAAAKAKAQGWGNIIPPVVVQTTVDDYAVRNYKPPTIKVNAVIQGLYGKQVV